jgi:hypothetical protein
MSTFSTIASIDLVHVTGGQDAAPAQQGGFIVSPCASLSGVTLGQLADQAKTDPAGVKDRLAEGMAFCGLPRPTKADVVTAGKRRF